MSPLVAQAPTDRIILGKILNSRCDEGLPKLTIMFMTGLMTFGTAEDQGARVTDINDFNKALDLFQARGYNEVDTARVYVARTQESFTREARWRDRGLTLATKVQYPSAPGDNAADKVVASVETSLRELGTDCVDLLYLHAPDRGTPFAESLEALDKLHKAGKFVRLGLSNFTAFEVAEIVMTCKYNGWVRPTVYQGCYNVLMRTIEPELVTACRRYGLDIVVYNPIAGGLFSGKIKSKDMIPESGRFSDTSKTGALYRKRYYKDTTFNALKKIEEAVAKHGLTMIETALRWVVHHSALKIKDGNDGILIGVSSVQQLDENLTHLEKGPLPDDLVKSLDEAWHIAKPDAANYWHLDLEYKYNTRQALLGAGTK